MAEATSDSVTLTLDENEKRWIVVGVAIHKVLASTLRGCVNSSMKSLFSQYRNDLLKQSSSNYHKRDPQNANASFNYASVNGNENISKRSSNEWNFCIKDHHEFAKLYLSPFMAKFSNLTDKSCDISPLLTILSASSAFTFRQQDAAKLVKDDVRNPWGHCEWDIWDMKMYTYCFQLMKDLVKSLGLADEEETATISNLTSWEEKGVNLCWKESKDEAYAVDLKDCIDFLTSIADNETLVWEALAELKEKVQRLTDLDKDVALLYDSVLQSEIKDASQEERLDMHEKRLTSLEKSPGGLFDDPWNLFDALEILGYGSFATVFKVRHRLDGKDYALKQSHRPPKKNKLKQCEKEIEVNSKLLNPHVARYFGTFHDSVGKVYIQMELCGKDLGSYLENNELIETKIRPHSLNILEELLRGLDYIHSEGLIHRDLKPSNIFVKYMDENVFIKIGDFGLVSFQDDSQTSCTGSPLYRAPEQQDQNYDSKVDMYTLGIDLFEIQKRVNKESSNWSDNIKRLRRETEIILTEFEPFEPKGWKTLIGALLKKIPKERPSASDILENLPSILYEEASSLASCLKTEKSAETPKELVPREYQIELAKPGLEGNNTIICAPTGCGKTIVALMIIKRHIEFHSDLPFKVVFLACDKILVDQHMNVLRYYLPSNTRIQSMSGNDTKEVPFFELFAKNDILVVTHQILLNSLQGKRIAIDQVSLLLFDECHHTDKAHVYMKIMTRYLTIKIRPGNTEKKLPQIVGLTASIGVGSGKTFRGAIDHVIKICSHLDAKILMTVKDNKEELARYCNSPDSNILNVPKRSVQDDIFIQEVEKAMNEIEEKVKQEYLSIEEEYRTGLTPYPIKGTLGFGQWSKILEEDIGVKQSNRCIISCASTLYAYNEALMFYEDLPIGDAQKHLSRFFDEKRRKTYSQTETWLDEQFVSLADKVKQHIDQCGKPNHPKLNILSDHLLKIYTDNKESKVVLFTTTRFHTSTLVKWLKNNIELKGLIQPGRLVGAHSSGDLGGSTQNEQLATIAKFKSGELNLLVATDAAGEGIDIEDCNALITYSHKTNVIGMVQKRGRARAEKANYIVIAEATSTSKVREETNLIHEAMMLQAVQEVQNMQVCKREEYDMKLNQIQEEIVTEFIKSEEIKSSKLNLPPSDVEVHCRECDTYIFPASSLRRVVGSHHTSITDFSSKYKLHSVYKPIVIKHEIDGEFHESKTRSKILCSECGSQWGAVMSFKSLDIPTLKVVNLKFKINGGTYTYKKWKKVPFDIAEGSIFNLK